MFCLRTAPFLLFTLLPNKSCATYERLYTILKELAELKPELILCDFEQAQSNVAGCMVKFLDGERKFGKPSDRKKDSELMVVIEVYLQDSEGKK